MTTDTTSSVLAEIVAAKRRDVAERKARRPRADLEPTLRPSTRSFEQALRRPGPRFVLECKRRSPSRGVLRDPFDVDELADGYRGVADAVSVLTDERFFGGGFDVLEGLRARLDVPLLCKDFVVDPWQVLEARAHGADAVLLMMSVLDDATAAECLREAARWDVDALVEVHDEDELARAIALDARVLGVNNRDLRTLDVDLATTERLAPLVPADRVVVAESGVRDRRDVDRLAPHADAFLVGSSLMPERDLATAARALVFGRVKICGLTRVGDARAAREAGASYGGFVFASSSPRRIDVDVAADIARAVAMPFVGVFVDERPEAVAAIAELAGLAAVQLHGNESDEVVAQTRRALPDRVELWRAVPVTPDGPADVTLGAADRLLFDTAGARFGGTGATFDWTTVADHPQLDRALLAGGLDAASIAAARRVGAFALDVGSRVESSPGRKDPDALRALFDAARGTARSDLPSAETPR